MAQSRDSARSGANTSATDGKSSGANPPAPTSSTPSGRFNLARLSGLLGPRPAAGQPSGANKDQTAKRPGWSRLLFGMLIFIVVAQLLQYALLLLSARFPQWRLTQNAIVPDRNFPVLGSLPAFDVIYFAGIALLWFGLYRFNILPRDPFGARARAAERAVASRPTTGGAPGGTRAERRYSARHAATTTSSKPASARQVAAQARATASASAAASAPSGSDTEYERVRAAQRQRRRRATKR